MNSSSLGGVGLSEAYWKSKEAAREFEAYWNQRNKAALEKRWGLVERLAKKTLYSSLLDVGCGLGNLIAFTSLATKENYLGIDISPPMIDRARELHPGYNFKVADPMDVHEEVSGLRDLVVAHGFLLHQHDLFLKLHRLEELTKTCLIFDVLVAKEGYSKRSQEGYWKRVIGIEEYMFLKRDLITVFRLKEVEFDEWGSEKEYYLRCERHGG